MDHKEKNYSRNPMNSPSYGEFSPTLEAMLRRLTKLKISNNQNITQKEKTNSSTIEQKTKIL